ncbi:MAG: hypothetical protein WCT36_01230 [Candidatus Gracilibacteria bacterium]|jgi:hypothetical protein
MELKRKTKKAIIICTLIVLISGALTLILWTFVNGENHWDLFGTKIDKILVNYHHLLKFLFSIPLAVPLLFQRHKITILMGLLTIPLFLFFHFSFIVFVD